MPSDRCRMVRCLPVCAATQGQEGTHGRMFLSHGKGC
uniref:Uncharacterized protein n=1 Tax=Anguilla anguilla TaxID=7936 RepID=A0A0E9VS47_ANGAN